jgi:hypothetical protein
VVNQWVGLLVVCGGVMVSFFFFFLLLFWLGEGGVTGLAVVVS